MHAAYWAVSKYLPAAPVTWQPKLGFFFLRANTSRLLITGPHSMEDRQHVLGNRPVIIFTGHLLSFSWSPNTSATRFFSMKNATVKPGDISLSVLQAVTATAARCPTAHQFSWWLQNYKNLACANLGNPAQGLVPGVAHLKNTSFSLRVMAAGK